MIKLKICGMREPANINAVAELRPDYMGFIFYESSPRYVGENFSLNKEFSVTRAVGVFVNEKTGKILEHLKSIGSKIAQLHGSETPSQCDELKRQGVSVIKVFSIDEVFDFNKTKEYAAVADFFLFDTKGMLYGGNAKVFNWNKLKEYDQRIPFFLSGGLNPENVKDLSVLEKMNVHALDVNSGVEDAPGIKNIERIKSVMSCLK
jgi:phosphoribosylanthranilate isomerase